MEDPRLEACISNPILDATEIPITRCGELQHSYERAREGHASGGIPGSIAGDDWVDPDARHVCLKYGDQRVRKGKAVGQGP